MHLAGFMIIFTIICTLRLGYCHQLINICNSTRKSFFLPIEYSGIISAWDLNTETNNLSKCQVDLVTCSSCMIVAKIWLLELPKINESTADGRRVEKSCNEDRIEIAEPYNKALVRRLFCPIFDGNRTVSKFIYRSQTNSMMVNFYYSANYTHPFNFEYTVKRNIRNFEILPNADSLENTITSPFFPIHYPSDYRAQYNIKCSSKIIENCRIKIFFLDYQLAPPSLLEFYESRTSRIGITSGRIFRPPIMISSGRMFSINFYANKASNFGFKFNYSAILGENNSTSLKPETSCGGYVEDIGGTIIMTKMVTEFETVAYDCIWIIKPTLGNYFKSHLLVKIISFFDMEHPSRLEIHQGLTSGHKKVKQVTFRHNLNSTIVSEELIGSINIGFYIYLHGLFNSKSRFILSYSAFSLSNFHETEDFVQPIEIPVVAEVCFMASDFLCLNHRCISGHLRCDGFDHCGDDSDELQCANKIDEYYHHKNYYFPKTESFSYLPTGLIFAFFTTASIFLLCSLICTLLYRTQQPYELNRALGTLNQMIAEHRPRNRNNSSEIASNQEPPPSYESPPNYQEIMEMQIFLDNQTKRSKEPKCMYNRSTCREFRNSSAGCSHSLITSRDEESIPHSSSDENSYDAEEILPKPKKHTVFRKTRQYAKSSFDSTTSTDSNIIMKNHKTRRIDKKKKLRNNKVVLKDKMKLLLSKSANNLVRENSNDYLKIRLSKSVEGLPSQLKLINRDFYIDRPN